MKKNILLLILFTMTSFSHAQVLFHHKLNSSRLSQFGFRLLDATGNAVDLCTTRNGVISVSGGKISFDLWQIQDTVTCTNGISASSQVSTLSIVQSRPTFGDPTLVLRVPFQSVSIGVNALPFRFRPKVKLDNGTTISSAGTTAFSLGLNAGYTFGISSITTRAVNNYSLTIGAYAGPSTVELKKGVYKDQTKYVADRTATTLSYGANVVLARNSLGLVFALGFEKAFGDNSEQWIYNNKLYYGFGVNTSFGK